MNLKKSLLLTTIILMLGSLFAGSIRAQSCNYTNYSLSPSGYVCSNGPVTITMSGSQTGVTYQLENPAGGGSTPIPGTGSALTWTNVGLFSGVPYSVVATAGSCPATTVATTTINYESNTAGGTITAPNGTSLCSTGSVTLTIQPTVAESDYSYQWFYNNAPQNNTNVQSYVVSQPGTYFAVIHNTCSGSQLAPITVTAATQLGTLTIDGSVTLTSSTSSNAYTASAANASGYSWTIKPSLAGTISGTGTTGTVTWNTTFAGIATIGVTANGCSGITTSGTYEVAYNATNANYNYVEETDVRTANITTLSGLSGLAIGSVDITYNYLDGLGRPIQKVMQGASQTSKDIVQPIAYDPEGREAKTYMPYSTTGTAGAYRDNALTGNTGYLASGQYTFYQSNAADHVNTTAPYAQTVFEASPVSRTVVQGFAGTAWQTSGTNTHRLNYTFNNTVSWSSSPSTSMSAALYTATINSDGSRTLARTGNSAIYNANTLNVIVSEDENYTTSMGRAGTTEEYKDMLGHTVLKRAYNLKAGSVEVLSTYYVYDINGDLAFVLPPMAGGDGTTAISTATLNNLCYQYQYDERNRLTAKKLPGKGWDYIVYNNADQVVASQDANQNAAGQWLVTKYDALGRVIMTGLWNSTATPAALKTSVYAAPQWDVRNPSDMVTGYTISSYPQTINQYLTINYYDDYTAPGMPTQHKKTGSLMTTGLLTAGKIAVLDPANPGVMLWTVNYFDDLGRTTEIIKQHYQGGAYSTSNYNDVVYTYNFDNQPATATRYFFNVANGTTPTLTIANTYVYDKEGRKSTVAEQITNAHQTADVKVTLSKTVYNEIAQVASRQLHTPAGGTAFQTVGYAYNERGWLNSISAPLFSENLEYNVNTYTNSGGTLVVPTASFTPQYNGNIVAQVWTNNTQPTQYYAYSYDNLDRLSGSTSSNGDNESGIVYDQNGNISNLQRSFNGNTIDQLTYNYTLSSNPTNQVQSIQDINNDASGQGYGYGTFTYTYDADGNLHVDNFRKRTVTSNILDLPMTNVITGTGAGTITFIYDADGNKLRKTSTAGSGSNTDYIDGIEYDNGTLSFIQTEEGKAIPASASAYNYEYNLTDHLGNVRLSFDTQSGTANAVQQDDYYPFGTDIAVSSKPFPPNNYLYNKKELQTDLYVYDYGARFYDPTIARWTSIDPMAEASRRWSVYNYVMNNPIMLIDLNGKIWDDPSDANALLLEVVKKLIADNKAIDEDQAKIDQGGDKKALDKLDNTIKELNDRVTSLNNSVADIVDLGNDQNHHYSLAGPVDGPHNFSTRDENGVIQIHGGNDAEHIHEISHVNISLMHGDLDNEHFWLNDILQPHYQNGTVDEIFAYQKQFAFDENSFTSPDLPRPNSINDINPDYLSRLNSGGEPTYPAIYKAVQEQKAKEKKEEQQQKKPQ